MSLRAPSVRHGWGISDDKEGSATRDADTINMDTIAKEHSYRKLAAHGLAICIGDGLMGTLRSGERWFAFYQES